MKDEKLIRGIMKAAKSRDAWDSKSKTYFLNTKEWKSVEGLKFPMKLGKSEATVQPDTQTLKVILKNYAKGKTAEHVYVHKSDADIKVAAAMDFHKVDVSICKNEGWYYERDGKFYKLMTKGFEEMWAALPEGASTIKEETIEPHLDEATDDKSKDFLAWVGAYAYPTIKSFVDEVTEKGIAKKWRPGIKGFLPGESRLFFAHDEGVKGEGVVIGYCIPELVKGSLNVPIQKRLSGLIMDDTDATYAVGKFIETGMLSFNGQARTKKLIRIDGDALLGAATQDKLPNQMRVTKVKVKSGEPSSRWTEDERKALIKCVEDIGSVNEAFREYSAATGRSVRSVEYQWYGPIKRLKLR